MRIGIRDSPGHCRTPKIFLAPLFTNNSGPHHHVTSQIITSTDFQNLHSRCAASTEKHCVCMFQFSAMFLACHKWKHVQDKSLKTSSTHWRPCHLGKESEERCLGLACDQPALPGSIWDMVIPNHSTAYFPVGKV